MTSQGYPVLEKQIYINWLEMNYVSPLHIYLCVQCCLFLILQVLTQCKNIIKSMILFMEASRALVLCQIIHQSELPVLIVHSTKDPHHLQAILMDLWIALISSIYCSVSAVGGSNTGEASGYRTRYLYGPLFGRFKRAQASP